VARKEGEKILRPLGSLVNHSDEAGREGKREAGMRKGLDDALRSEGMDDTVAAVVIHREESEYAALILGVGAQRCRSDDDARLSIERKLDATPWISSCSVQVSRDSRYSLHVLRLSCR
jgi:hypothetical protein